MATKLQEWLSCPSCESPNTGLLAYNETLCLECYDCGVIDEFELGDPPLHEFGTH